MTLEEAGKARDKAWARYDKVASDNMLGKASWAAVCRENIKALEAERKVYEIERTGRDAGMDN